MHVKSIIKNNFYLLVSWLSLYLINLFIAHNTAFWCHQSRVSIVTAFLSVLVLSCGRFISSIMLPIIYALSVFLICIIVKYGLLTSPILIAIMTVEASTALSMIKAQGLPVIVVMLVVGGIGVWQGRRYGAFRPYLVCISAAVMIAGVAQSYSTIYRQDHRFSEKEAKYADFMSQTPGLIGSVVYAAYVASHQNAVVVHPHTKVPREIIGHRGDKKKNIVLVVGETGFVGRYSVYGYSAQPTTPAMQVLKDNKYICIVRNVHSSANLTREAVPTLLSFYGAGRKEALYSEKNLVELAKDQGYHTYWIGAQEGRGIYARPYGYISEFSDYLIRPDYKNGHEITKEDDSSLLPFFRDKASETYQNKLFILHLHGSHIGYDEDYDPEDKAALPTSDDYDRSVHKTDRILKSVIDIAKEKLGDFDFIYIPDHGEIINKGHGLQYGGYDQYKVPLYIKNVGSNCNDIERYRGENGYINDLAIRALIATMMGYQLSQDYLDDMHKNDFVIHSDAHVYSYDAIPR